MIELRFWKSIEKWQFYLGSWRRLQMEKLNSERLRSNLSGLRPNVLQHLDVGKEDDPAKEIEGRIKGKPRLCGNMEVEGKIF